MYVCKRHIRMYSQGHTNSMMASTVALLKYTKVIILVVFWYFVASLKAIDGCLCLMSVTC